MAETPNICWDREGHAHTNALHWEGFPRLLWESLQIFGYDAPSLYDRHEFVEVGVPRCRVKMTSAASFSLLVATCHNLHDWSPPCGYL
jgi:hypothetical protein